MDVVQEHVFKKVYAFVGEKFEYLEPGKQESCISLNQREAYVVLKMFENQKKTRIFEKQKEDGFWWFRIFGYGLCCKEAAKYPLLFSERNGNSKYIKIGRWRLKWLKRRRFPNPPRRLSGIGG